MPVAEAADILNTGVNNSPGYSYNNRRYEICIAKFRATHFLLRGVRQTGFETVKLLAKRVCGFRHSGFPGF
jgi:hypothetical protein